MTGSGRLSDVEYLIARFGEDELEDKIRQGGDDRHREALRCIDKMQAAGTYETERARLRAWDHTEIEALTKIFGVCEERPAGKLISDGLDSPDDGERKKFEKFFEVIDDNDLWDEGLTDLLKQPKQPPKAKGRKRGRAYPGDAALLLEMKALARDGLTSNKAAESVADRAEGNSATAKVDRLRHAFAAKMALRDLGEK